MCIYIYIFLSPRAAVPRCRDRGPSQAESMIVMVAVIVSVASCY